MDATRSRPYIALAVAAVAVYVLSVTLLGFVSRARRSSYPLVGNEKKRVLFGEIRQRLDWFKNGPKVIHDAYEKNPSTIFELPSLDRTSIVLPARFLKEIKELPNTIASNSHATSDFFVGTWTTLDYDMFGHANLDAIRTQYITKLGMQVGPAADEAEDAFHKNFSGYPEWTPIKTQPRILQIVAQMVARTVVGSELCRNPQWIDSVVGYAQNVFMATVYMKLVPSIMRPLLAAFTPYLYRIHLYRHRILKLVTPTINQSLALHRDDPEEWTVKEKTGEMNTVDWLVKTSPEDEATPKMMAHRLTGVSFGATHTTTNHVTNCLLDLAADFERWAVPLREEIEEVLGSNPGNITNADLSKMWKLDSFMKESQRFHPPSKLSVNRKVMKPFTLSSGDPLPQDAHISFAGVPMSMSSEYFPDAKTFDGFRFERMRQDPELNHSGLQFTSSYAGSLHFGHGRHMCPGRFMGSLISKLLVIEVLQRYDLKLRAGEGRPENLMFMDMDIPNPEYEILFRNRKV